MIVLWAFGVRPRQVGVLRGFYGSWVSGFGFRV